MERTSPPVFGRHVNEVYPNDAGRRTRHGAIHAVSATKVGNPQANVATNDHTKEYNLPQQSKVVAPRYTGKKKNPRRRSLKEAPRNTPGRAQKVTRKGHSKRHSPLQGSLAHVISRNQGGKSHGPVKWVVKAAPHEVHRDADKHEQAAPKPKAQLNIVPTAVRGGPASTPANSFNHNGYACEPSEAVATNEHSKQVSTKSKRKRSKSNSEQSKKKEFVVKQDPPQSAELPPTGRKRNSSMKSARQRNRRASRSCKESSTQTEQTLLAENLVELEAANFRIAHLEDEVQDGNLLIQSLEESFAEMRKNFELENADLRARLAAAEHQSEAYRAKLWETEACRSPANAEPELDEEDTYRGWLHSFTLRDTARVVVQSLGVYHPIAAPQSPGLEPESSNNAF